MASNAPLPKAEAKVQVQPPGQGWKDSLDFDPIMLPVETTGRDGAPISTDVFDSSVHTIVESMREADNGTWGYRLVWSRTVQPVLGQCPDCDTTFPVDEGVPIVVEDQGPGIGGVVALGCGCRDEDD